MKSQKITLRAVPGVAACPDCGSSDDIIPWGDGWMSLRDCAMSGEKITVTGQGRCRGIHQDAAGRLALKIKEGLNTVRDIEKRTSAGKGKAARETGARSPITAQRWGD